MWEQKVSHVQDTLLSLLGSPQGLITLCLCMDKMTDNNRSNTHCSSVNYHEKYFKISVVILLKKFNSAIATLLYKFELQVPLSFQVIYHQQ